jgi:hypothetical protein
LHVPTVPAVTKACRREVSECYKNKILSLPLNASGRKKKKTCQSPASPETFKNSDKQKNNINLKILKK